MSLIQRPSQKLARLIDPTKKIFEGEVTTQLYKNRVITKGYCWHCKSKVYTEMLLTAGEALQSEQDAQFRENLIEISKDRIQDYHQCGLLAEGKTNIEDTIRQLSEDR